MASENFERPAFRASAGDADELAYREGYRRAMRELAWARSQGFVPTERQFVLALSQAQRVYEVAHHGKAIGGRHPEWLRGRADALRELIKRGVAALPAADDPTNN
jgi:hypothetical protein